MLSAISFFICFATLTSKLPYVVRFCVFVMCVHIVCKGLGSLTNNFCTANFLNHFKRAFKFYTVYKR